MWQNIITALIVAVALFFIGRKVYRQFRQIVDPSKEITCGCSCSGCNSVSCDSKKKTN